MTPNEFKAWLDGYMTAGGKDAEVIAAKAKEISSFQPSYPTFFRDGGVVPLRSYQTNPDWHPYTTCYNGEVQ